MLGELVFRNVTANKNLNASPPLTHCRLCRKAPPEGKRLQACTQCQAVVYCSRECQRKDWKTHKLPCSKSGGFLKEIRRLDRAKAAQHEAHSMPPFEQRMALFEDFLKAHSFLLTRAREAAVCGVKGGPDSFDFNNTYLLVALSYRVDCEGNPARAFRVECVDLVRYNQEKYNAATHKALEAGRARLDALCGARSLGSLRIMYRTAERHSEEDLRKWDVQPVFKPAWQAQKLNVPRLPNPHRMCIDRYYSELVSATEHGLVLRHDAEAGRCVIGELVKSGTQWRWEQLTPAQLLERGLPAGFNDLMYDLKWS